MWSLCWIVAALASEIVVEAEVPVEVIVRGEPAAQLFRAGSVHVPADPGDYELTLFVAGRPNKLIVTVPPDGQAHIVVGRTGITTRTTLLAAPTAEATVEVRVVGKESLRLQVDGERWRMAPGDQRTVKVPAGIHKLELRNADGTVVFAAGDLEVRGTGPVLVQISEGRAPEVVGSTGVWRPAVR